MFWVSIDSYWCDEKAAPNDLASHLEGLDLLVQLLDSTGGRRAEILAFLVDLSLGLHTSPSINNMPASDRLQRLVGCGNGLDLGL